MGVLYLFERVTSRDLVVCGLSLIAGSLIYRFYDMRKQKTFKDTLEDDDESSETSSQESYDEDDDEDDTDDYYSPPTVAIRDDYSIRDGGRYKMVYTITPSTN